MFIFSDFTLRSIIHLEYFYMIQIMDLSWFLHRDIPLFQGHLLKMLSFLRELLCIFVKNSCPNLCVRVCVYFRCMVYKNIIMFYICLCPATWPSSLLIFTFQYCIYRFLLTLGTHDHANCDPSLRRLFLFTFFLSCWLTFTALH